MSEEKVSREELLLCCKINFENLERARPDVRLDPFYVIAKNQLDEAITGEEVELKIPEFD